MKSICTLLFSFLLFTSFSQSIEVPIDQVKIFFDGAEIQRATKTQFEKGKTNLEIRGISPFINEQSLRVKFNESIRVLSFNVEGDPNYSGAETQHYKSLLQSNRRIDLLKKQYSSKKTALTSQLSYLNENKTSLGTRIDTTQLKQYALFFYQQHLSIEQSRLDLDLQLDSLVKVQSSIQSKINSLQEDGATQFKKIILQISSDQSQLSDLKINYMVNSAGWQPFHDLFSAGISSPIEIIQKAKAYNYTGIDWKDAKISITTASQKLSIDQPQLEPWDVNKKSQYSFSNNSRSVKNVNSIKYQTIDVPLTYIDYPISNSKTMLSSRKPQIFQLEQHKLEANYWHYAVPEIEDQVYLLSSITGWENLNLLPGKTNVYLKGEYIGHTQLNPTQIGDTLDLSLGRDNEVKIEKTTLRDYSQKNLLRSGFKKTLSYQYTIKNLKSIPIQIEIMDQVPISNDNTIHVQTKENSGGVIETKSGFISWKKEILPNQSHQFDFSFSVKTTTKTPFQISRKFRSIACPEF